MSCEKPARVFSMQMPCRRMTWNWKSALTGVQHCTRKLFPLCLADIHDLLSFFPGPAVYLFPPFFSSFLQIADLKDFKLTRHFFVRAGRARIVRRPNKLNYCILLTDILLPFLLHFSLWKIHSATSFSQLIDHHHLPVICVMSAILLLLSIDSISLIDSSRSFRIPPHCCRR